MKTLITLTLFLLPFSALADEPGNIKLKPAEGKFVCMVNNHLYEKVQFPVEVNGKTYYGCCPMCKDRLKTDVTLREATDPISKKKVDKATAVVGATPDGRVFYFENEKHMKKYLAPPAPPKKEAAPAMPMS